MNANDLNAFTEKLLNDSGFDTVAKRELRARVLEAIRNNASYWAACWQFTDAYGPVGYMPAQGYDWSGFRDSSYVAVANMADAMGIR